MATQCLDSDMPDEALRLITEAVERNPLDFRLYVTRGFANIRRDNLPKALDDFRLALKNARSSALEVQALLLVARTERSLGQHAEAFAHASQAAKLDTAHRVAETAGLPAYEAALTIGSWFRSARPPAEAAAKGASLVADAIAANPTWFAPAWVNPSINAIPAIASVLTTAVERQQSKMTEVERAFAAVSPSLAEFERALGRGAGESADLAEFRRDIGEARTQGSYAKMRAVHAEAVRYAATLPGRIDALIAAQAAQLKASLSQAADSTHRKHDAATQSVVSAADAQLRDLNEKLAVLEKKSTDLSVSPFMALLAMAAPFVGYGRGSTARRASVFLSARPSRNRSRRRWVHRRRVRGGRHRLDGAEAERAGRRRRAARAGRGVRGLAPRPASKSRERSLEHVRRRRPAFSRAGRETTDRERRSGLAPDVRLAVQAAT